MPARSGRVHDIIEQPLRATHASTRDSICTPCRLPLEDSVRTKSPAWTLLPPQTFFRLRAIRACRPRSYEVQDPCAQTSARLLSFVSFFYLTRSHLSCHPLERVSLSFRSRWRRPHITLNIGQGIYSFDWYRCMWFIVPPVFVIPRSCVLGL